jgi:hypothetical protein
LLLEGFLDDQLQAARLFPCFSRQPFKNNYLPYINRIWTTWWLFIGGKFVEMVVTLMLWTFASFYWVAEFLLSTALDSEEFYEFAQANRVLWVYPGVSISHEDRQRIAEFLQEQNALQRNLLGSLRKDPNLRSVCSDRAVEYNLKLLENLPEGNVGFRDRLK